MFVNPWLLVLPGVALLFIGFGIPERDDSFRRRIAMTAKFLGLALVVLWRFDLAHSAYEVQRRLDRRNAGTAQFLGNR